MAEKDGPSGHIQANWHCFTCHELIRRSAHVGQFCEFAWRMFKSSPTPSANRLWRLSSRGPAAAESTSYFQTFQPGLCRIALKIPRLAKELGWNSPVRAQGRVKGIAHPPRIT